MDANEQVKTMGYAYEMAYEIITKYKENEAVLLAIIANLIYVSENGKINEENN